MKTPKDKSTSGTKVLSFPGKKSDRKTAVAKYGVDVMNHGFTLFLNLLLQSQGRLEIKAGEFNVLCHLIHFWWEADRKPFPSKDMIGRRMGLTGRQIQRILTSLEEKGLIRRIERFNGPKGQTSNEYDLTGLVEKLKEIEQRKIRQKKVESKAS